MTPTCDEDLRVVVVGSSIGYYVRPPRAFPAERNYAEHVEWRLRASGQPTVVTNSSRWTHVAGDCLRDVEKLVLQHRPHVVIIHVGLIECEPNALPMPLLRWLFRQRPPGVGQRVRPAAAERLRRFYVWYSPRLLRRVPMPTRVAECRFEAELRALIGRIRNDRSALVLLLNISPPGPTWKRSCPERPRPPTGTTTSSIG